MVLLQVAGSERHDEVPESNERTVALGEQADHHVVVVHHVGHLLPREQALLHDAGRAPVEHPRAVVVVADQVGLLVQAQLLVNLERCRQLGGERTQRYARLFWHISLGNLRIPQMQTGWRQTLQRQSFVGRG